MAFVEKIVLDDGIIGIWEISDVVDVLVRQFHFFDYEKEEFNKISFEKRKKEYLAVRLLLKKLLNTKPEIVYDNSGRPALKNFDLHLSISHSKDLVVVFISNQKIGVDVENLERKIENVAHRFLHESEWDLVKTSESQQRAMILLWSAKEAIFKCSEKQGIHFNKQIVISSFPEKEEEQFSGVKIHDGKTTNYHLQYFIRQNNVVVFCVEEVEK